MRVSQGRKIAVLVAAAAAIASTPVIWLMNGPGTGQFVAATVQGAAGVVAVVWALISGPGTPAQPPEESVDVAVDTGNARATGGGSANTGVTRTGGADSGRARVERTGNATADGPGSDANSGIKRN